MTYTPTVWPRGPRQAKILIVGEAPGENEVTAGKPFVGNSGRELDKLLQEAGIIPMECRYTNVVNVRPPNNKISLFFRSSKKKASEDGALFRHNKYVLPVVLDGIEELKEEIKRVQPNLVIALGNTALWALTGKWGITNWRSSEMESLEEFGSVKVIPTLHPAFLFRAFHYRWIAVHDLKRCKRESETPYVNVPAYDFIVRPAFSDVMDYINLLRDRMEREKVPLAVDIETRSKHIACVGLADSAVRAICIPFMCVEDDNGYWSVEEEAEIVWQLKALLTHKNVEVIGQNFMYDNQYFARRWGFIVDPLRLEDTMMKQHVCFPGVSKGLDFISSMYCEYHCYWKSESKEWQKNQNEEELWIYNCKDAVTTFESNFELDKVLDHYELRELYNERMLTSRTAFRMMLRGTRTDTRVKAKISLELAEALMARQDWLYQVLDGFPLFGAKGGVSPQKMMKLAYDVLQLPPKRVKTAEGGYRLTADKNAIKEWLEGCEPIFRPILNVINDYRSLTVFKSTFADASLDTDSRFRCSFNVAGPHTFRWSSSEDAFGLGTNTQNIPKGDKDD